MLSNNSQTPVLRAHAPSINRHEPQSNADNKSIGGTGIMPGLSGPLGRLGLDGGLLEVGKPSQAVTVRSLLFRVLWLPVLFA